MKVALSHYGITFLIGILVVMCAYMIRDAFRSKAVDGKDKLIYEMWLYIGRHAEQQLSTEDRELLYDILDRVQGEKHSRWWHES